VTVDELAKRRALRSTQDDRSRKRRQSHVDFEPMSLVVSLECPTGRKEIVMAGAPAQATSTRSFGPELFRFLKDLKANNDRAWFAENKDRYENEVRDPALDFVEDFAPHLREISPHFLADPRPSGGSLFRIHRDIRFSKDKSPYKPYVGIQFRHERAKDAHTPGFYLHLQPGGVFVAAGIWHPDAPTLARIREAIGDDPNDWRRATRSQRLGGESLKRAPAGFDSDHPLIEDLKRKDFIASVELTQKDACAPGFIERFASTCQETSPLVRFLCGALDLPY
jgi:uncharacterized protein (TIGR02453 family)